MLIKDYLVIVMMMMAWSEGSVGISTKSKVVFYCKM